MEMIGGGMGGKGLGWGGGSQVCKEKQEEMMMGWESCMSGEGWEWGGLKGSGEEEGGLDKRQEELWGLGEEVMGMGVVGGVGEWKKVKGKIK